MENYQESKSEKGKNKNYLFKGKNQVLFILFILLTFTGSLLIFNVIYEKGVPNVIADMNNAALGAILVAIITVFLLKEQSESEEIRERNSSVFDKKIIIYERFIEKIKSIANDNEITPQELNEIIFELAILGIHTKGTNIEEIWKSFGGIVDLFKNKKEEIKQTDLSDKLFKIVLIFQNELYGEDKGKPNLNELNKITDNIDKWSKKVFSSWDEYYNCKIINSTKELLNLTNLIIEDIKSSYGSKLNIKLMKTYILLQSDNGRFVLAPDKSSTILEFWPDALDYGKILIENKKNKITDFSQYISLKPIIEKIIN